MGLPFARWCPAPVVSTGRLGQPGGGGSGCCRVSLLVDALDDRGDPLADADAHRGEAVATTGAPQFVR
jgi:hypothetical protein